MRTQLQEIEMVCSCRGCNYDYIANVLHLFGTWLKLVMEIVSWFPLYID